MPSFSGGQSARAPLDVCRVQCSGGVRLFANMASEEVMDVSSIDLKEMIDVSNGLYSWGTVEEQSKWLVGQLLVYLQWDSPIVVGKAMVALHALLTWGSVAFAKLVLERANDVFDVSRIDRVLRAPAVAICVTKIEDVEYVRQAKPLAYGYLRALCEFRVKYPTSSLGTLGELPIDCEALCSLYDDAVELMTAILTMDKAIVQLLVCKPIATIRIVMDAKLLYAIISRASLKFIQEIQRQSGNERVSLCILQKGVKALRHHDIMNHRLEDLFKSVRTTPMGEKVSLPEIRHLPPDILSRISSSIEEEKRLLTVEMASLSETLSMSTLVDSQPLRATPELKQLCSPQSSNEHVSQDTLLGLSIVAADNSYAGYSHLQNSSNEQCDASNSPDYATDSPNSVDSLFESVVMITSKDCYRCEAKVQLERFTLLASETLGKGSFGTVYKAWDEEEGKYVACKEITIAKSSTMENTNGKGVVAPERGGGLRDILQEYNVLTSLQHANIVQVVAFMAKKNTGRIFMEWVPAGSVMAAIRNGKPLREPVVRRYTADALEGLAYLHEKGIVHRDVKPANMLLTGEGRVKLSDFGTSHLLTRGEHTIETNSVIGTIPFMAPETFRGYYSPACDVWAIGCSVIQMVTGYPPWIGSGAYDPIPLMFKIGNLSEHDKGPHEALEPQISSGLFDFLRSTFVFERKHRPSAKELLAHPFIARVHPAGS